MILAIDVGNTNIVLGCLENKQVLFTVRLQSDRNKTGDEYAVQFYSILKIHGIDPKKIDGSIISSVMPRLIAPLKTALKKVTDTDALVVGPGIKTGIPIIIDNPAQLGSDLVVGAVAAMSRYQPPLVLFDLGTATTMSVIDRSGRFLGGAIFPGVRISQDALSSRTSQLPYISLDESPKAVIGTNTVDSMQSGAIFGTAAMLDGMITRAEEELGDTATVVVTGGLAKSIAPYCKREVIVEEDLLLLGLALIYEKNK